MEIISDVSQTVLHLNSDKQEVFDMNISAVQSTQFAYGAIFTQKTSKTIAESTSGRSAGPDSINISDKAKAMAVKTKAEQGDQVKNGAAPIDPSMSDSRKELMYFPETYCDLLPDTAVVCAIGAPTYTGPTLTAEQVKDQNEYIDMLSKIYREERNNQGIYTTEDYLNQTKNNNKLNDKIYQAIRDRLDADPHAMELRQKVFSVS